MNSRAIGTDLGEEMNTVSDQAPVVAFQKIYALPGQQSP